MSSIKALAILILFAVVSSLPMARGQSSLHLVRLSNCRADVCTSLSTLEVSQSSLSPNLMAFGGAQMTLVDAVHFDKILQVYDATDGYFDMHAQVIVLRGLKNSVHRELIYNLNDGHFVYF